MSKRWTPILTPPDSPLQVPWAKPMRWQLRLLAFSVTIALLTACIVYI